MTINELKFVIIVVLSLMIIYSRTRSIQSIMKYTTIVIYLLMFYSYLIYTVLKNLRIEMDFYVIPIMLSLLLIFVNIKYMKISHRSKVVIDVSFEDLLVVFATTIFYLLFKSNVITYDTLAFFIPLGYDMFRHPSLIPQSSVFGTDTPVYPYFIVLLLYPAITINIDSYKLILQNAFYIYILNVIYFGYKFVTNLISNYLNLNNKQIRIITLLYILVILFSTPYFYSMLTQYNLHLSLLLSYFFLIVFERIYIIYKNVKISDIYIYFPLALSYDSMLLVIGLFLIFNLLCKLFTKYINNKAIFATTYFAIMVFIMAQNFSRYDFIIRLSGDVEKYVVMIPSLIIFSVLGMMIYKKFDINIIQDVSISKLIVLGLIILILIFPYLVNYRQHLIILESDEYIIWQQTISTYNLFEFVYNNIISYYYYLLFILLSLFFLIYKKINSFDLIYLLLIFVGTLLGLLVIDSRRFVFIVLLLFSFLLSFLTFKLPKYSLLVVLFTIIISYIFNSLIYPVFAIRNDIHIQYYNEVVDLLSNINCSKIYYFNIPFMLSYLYYSNNTYLNNRIVPYDLIRFEFYFSLSQINHNLLFTDNSCLILSKFQTTYFDKLYTRFYSKYFTISSLLASSKFFVVYSIKSVGNT